MRRALLLLALTASACGAQQQASDHVSDWLRVLHHKRAAVAHDASAEKKQVYADSLGAFVQRHPGHGRARQVYQRVQLDFAGELSALGRHQDAIRFYRAVLAQDPRNEAALHGFASEADRLSVSREKLLKLQKGMSEHEVARILGKPIPGWSQRIERRDSVVDAWYYRRTDGNVAGVYFRDGQLFAAEENSQARLVPLMQQTR
ncbi:MAG: hypothetical protein ABIP63_00830 [Thermoanaerobaculia bacterium]